jgi:hypothetical protein
MGVKSSFSRITWYLGGGLVRETFFSTTVPDSDRSAIRRF